MTNNLKSSFDFPKISVVTPSFNQGEIQLIGNLKNHIEKILSYLSFFCSEMLREEILISLVVTELVHSLL